MGFSLLRAHLKVSVSHQHLQWDLSHAEPVGLTWTRPASLKPGSPLQGVSALFHPETIKAEAVFILLLCVFKSFCFICCFGFLLGIPSVPLWISETPLLFLSKSIFFSYSNAFLHHLTRGSFGPPWLPWLPEGTFPSFLAYL